MRADPAPDRAGSGDDVRHAERGRPGPGAGGVRSAPLFIAGPDRSGTTLMYALLASHADVSMVRRTNMWRYFHGRYGDLADPANRERCLAAMVGYRRMRHLQPDPDRIRREFLQGAPTYGRLFALFHQHHAERAGARRWGDKSLHTEHYADRVFAEFPEARIIHMIRDPRDRYASVRNRHGQELSQGGRGNRPMAGVDPRRPPQPGTLSRPLPRRALRGPGAGTGSDHAPDLRRRRTGVLARASSHCPVRPSIATRGGNSSFGDLEPGTISTRAVGRFRSMLTPADVAFIQLVAGPQMATFGYEVVDVELSGLGRLRFWLATVPLGLARMVGWMVLAWARRRRGVPVPPAQRGGEPDDR